jgi:hypothetical protein
LEVKGAQKDPDRSAVAKNRYQVETVIWFNDDRIIMQDEEYDPAKVIGNLYHRGLLPYGGGVGPEGRIVFARSREDAERRL